MNKSVLILLSFFVFLFAVVPTVSASHRKRVLGVSTSTMPILAPTVQGPGFILPDSPLFFLDEIKQNVKLAFAFSPEQKAKVQAEIAGERLAELRVMLARKDESGIQKSLEGITENIKQAAETLSQAQFSGHDVSKTAQVLNTDIKEKQQTLDLLKEQSDGELRARVKVVSQALLDSKVKVEDSLSPADLENEIEDDLNRAIEERVQDASDSVGDLEADLDELTQQASSAAKQSLTNREEAIQKAIKDKNQELAKQQERLLEADRKKHDMLLKLHDKEAEEAKETIKKAQEAATRFRQVQKTVEEVKSTDVKAAKP